MNKLSLFYGLFRPSKYICAYCRHGALSTSTRPTLASRKTLPSSRTHASKSADSESGDKSDAKSEAKGDAKVGSQSGSKAKPKVKLKSKPSENTSLRRRRKALASRKNTPKTNNKTTPRVSNKARPLRRGPFKSDRSHASPKEQGVPFGALGESLTRVLGADGFTRSKPILLKGRSLSLGVVPVEHPPVPKLAHGLERALFNPGVIRLRDPRSRVYNFDPHLERLMPIREFDFNSLTIFTPPSRDEVLARIAKESFKKYIASTSSMTGILKQFHFLLSRWRPPNFDMLSKPFPASLTTYTKMTRSPDAVFLRWKNGVYAVDADKMYDSANVLSLMGRYMEKLLTVDATAFDRHRVDALNPITEDERSEPEAFHYSTLGDFLLRSQLDAQDVRLPGTGMFDLKTRAVVPIRMDSSDFEWGMDYEIRYVQGEWQSFEREYHDMIRSTMLKYSLQVRMGRMDGIFVAFHNIARIFGFQYISLEEMDYALHGQHDPTLGDLEFLHSLRLVNEAFNRATARFPEQTIRFHFETRETQDAYMYIFAEPVTEEEADSIQSTNKEKIQRWEESILSGNATEETTREDTVKPSLGEAAAQTEQDVTSDLVDKESNSDGTAASKDKTAGSEKTAKNAAAKQATPTKPLLGMILSVRSYVNDSPVMRPAKFSSENDWDIRYHLTDMESPTKAWSLYEACKARRHKEMSEEERKTADEDDYFRSLLRRISQEGRRWRTKTEDRERRAGREGEVHMWNERPADDAPASDAPEPAPAAAAQDAVVKRTLAILQAYRERDTGFRRAVSQGFVRARSEDPLFVARIKALYDVQRAAGGGGSDGAASVEAVAQQAAFVLVRELRAKAKGLPDLSFEEWKTAQQA